MTIGKFLCVCGVSLNPINSILGTCTNLCSLIIIAEMSHVQKELFNIASKTFFKMNFFKY